MPLTPKKVDELHEIIKKLLELWMRTKLVFLKAFGGGAIQPEHENAFLQLKTGLSRHYKKVVDDLPSGLNFDGDKMTEMLKNAMNMEFLKNQPARERQKILALWHNVYIKLTRTLGALDVMQSGYYPHAHRSRLVSRASKNKEKKKVPAK